MRKVIIAAVVLALVAALAWFVFGRGSSNTGEVSGVPGASDASELTEIPGLGDSTAPLGFVPADTPYVLANLQPFPRDVLEHWMQQMTPVVKLYQAQLANGARRVQASDPDSAAWMRALGAELEGKTPMQVMDAVGGDLGARFAFYGIELVPVMRTELADPAKLTGFIARIQERTGKTLPTAEIDGVRYWHVTPPEAKLRGIVAIQGKHLVLTVAPIDDDAALRTLLGITRPAQDMRDGTALMALNQQFGYLSVFSGFIDTSRIVAAVTAPASALEQAFFAQFEIEKPGTDAVCQAEYRDLAKVMPRLSMGYTHLDITRIDTVSRIELRPDIAQDLMGLRAPMPGLAQARNVPLQIGLSLRVGQLPALVSKHANKVVAEPWKCPALQGLNQAFEDGRAQIDNPMVFAVAPVFRGFHAIVSRLDLKPTGATPDISGKLLIGSDNPAALLGMAKGMVPPLASLQIKPDAVVHKLPPLPGSPLDAPTHIAMNNAVLGIAIGDGEESDLADFLQADDAQQPLLIMNYSGDIFAQLAEMTREAAASIGDPEAQAEAKLQADLMQELYGKFIRRVDSRVEFGDSGIELHQSVQVH